MLRKFKVSNFRGFEDEFILDFSNVNGYEFNKECIKNNIINNAVIYGKNGIGKSNLALAIFDIIEHLTDKYREESRYNNYLNAYSKSTFAEFYYEFSFDDNLIVYEYRKTDYKTILYEKMSINGNEIISFDRSINHFIINLKGAETLNRSISDNQLSALKYVKNNSVLEDNIYSKTFYLFFDFIESMLFFRSLEDRTYWGSDTDSNKILAEDIIERNNVDDFEKFLNIAGVECKLQIQLVNNKKVLYFDFNDKLIPFNDILSTGTSSLTLFYFWFQSIREAKFKFLFIDEFDAFYHHELAQIVIQKLKDVGIQFILTTHNTSNLTNDLLRPDCYFIMNKKKILSLSNSTDKELRFAHNIEKMYKSNSFNVE